MTSQNDYVGLSLGCDIRNNHQIFIDLHSKTTARLRKLIFQLHIRAKYKY